MTEREQLIRQAAAALDLLRKHRGEWVTGLDLLRAGIKQPSRAIALVQSLGKSPDARAIEASNPHPGSSFQRWRLPGPQMALEGLDAEQRRERR